MLSPNDSICIHNIVTAVYNESKLQPLGWYEWVSLIASVASFLGFIVTCIQLYKVKNTNKKIQKAVDNSCNRINHSLALITITDALRLSDMVIAFIQNGLYKQATLKLHDLNNAAIEISAIYQSLKKHQLRLPSEIDHLQDIDNCANIGQKSKYEISYTLSTIQQFNDALKEIEANVKMQIITS